LKSDVILCMTVCLIVESLIKIPYQQPASSDVGKIRRFVFFRASISEVGAGLEEGLGMEEGPEGLRVPARWQDAADKV